MMIVEDVIDTVRPVAHGMSRLHPGIQDMQGVSHHRHLHLWDLRGGWQGVDG